MASTVPKVVSVEVVPARPSEADRSMIAKLSSEVNRSIPDTAFIVKIGLEELPPPTAHGWALYIGDTRIPKYWLYPGGIYFKVLDEEFLADHQRQKLRFSDNGTDFIDTGVKLPRAGASRATRKAETSRLPLQSEVLEQSTPARSTRARASRKSTPRGRARTASTARKGKGRKSR